MNRSGQRGARHISEGMAWQFARQFTQAEQAGRVAGFFATKVYYVLFVVFLVIGRF